MPSIAKLLLLAVGAFHSRLLLVAIDANYSKTHDGAIVVIHSEALPQMVIKAIHCKAHVSGY